MKRVLLLLCCCIGSFYKAPGQSIPDITEQKLQEQLGFVSSGENLELSPEVLEDHWDTRSVFLPGPKKIQICSVDPVSLDDDSDLSKIKSRLCPGLGRRPIRENSRILRAVGKCILVDSSGYIDPAARSWYKAVLSLHDASYITTPQYYFLVTTWYNYNPNGSTSETKLKSVFVFDRNMRFKTSFSYLDMFSPGFRSYGMDNKGRFCLVYLDERSGSDAEEIYSFVLIRITDAFLAHPEQKGTLIKENLSPK